MEQERIIQEIEKAATQEIEKFGTPIPLHFGVSNDKGLELAKELGADAFVVQLGTRLMDFKLGQAISEGKISEHVKMSSMGARELLNQFKLSADIIEKVINCVEGHHKDVPWKYKEAEICANADCYRFLLPQTALAYLQVLGSRSQDFEKNLKFIEIKMQEKWGILSLDICKEELEKNYHLLKEVIHKAQQ